MDPKDLDGNVTPPEGGDGDKGTPPAGGDVTPPQGGDVTPPEGGKETPPEGGDGNKGDKGGSETPPGAPENYEKFSVPEGFEISQEVMDSFTPLAKEMNLSQEQAQDMVNLYADLRGRELKAQEKAFEEQMVQWEKEAKADPEIGGDKFDENCAIAKKGLEAFGDQELKDLFEKTGWGNHRAIIRAFYKAGTSIKEDSFFKEGGGGGKKSGVADLNEMYSTMKD